MDKELEYLVGWLSDGEIRDSIQIPHIANNDMIKKIRRDAKNAYVLEHVGKEPWQQTRTTKYGKEYVLWVLKVNGRYVTSSDRDKLIDKVFDLLVAAESETDISLQTLEEIYPKAMIYIRDNTNKSDKTLHEYAGVWNRNYADSWIAKKRIRDISAADWQDFFLEEIRKGSYKKLKDGTIERTGNLTRKRFSDIRGLGNLLYRYCSDARCPIINPIQNISTSNFPFREEDTSRVKAKAFTKKQEEAILQWCSIEMKCKRKRPIYPLALNFNLYVGLRFAEMAGLKWSDIDWENQTLLVHRQRVIASRMDDKLGFTGTGKEDLNYQKKHVAPHAIYLPDPAIKVLKKIQQLELSDEYVFPPGQFRYHTYNDKVKEAARVAGLKPEEYSTHCIRATMATNLYKMSGGDLRQVQYQMRHTTTQMTEKYIDDWWTLDAIKKAWQEPVR